MKLRCRARCCPPLLLPNNPRILSPTCCATLWRAVRRIPSRPLTTCPRTNLASSQRLNRCPSGISRRTSPKPTISFAPKLAMFPSRRLRKLTETDAKEKLVAAVKASFDFCGTALAKAEDAKLGDPIQDFGGKTKPRAWAALALAGSWSDHYGAAAMYLRLNGLLPPTAQKKPEEHKK